MSEFMQLITKPLETYHTKQLLKFRRQLEMDWQTYNYCIKYDYFNCACKPNYTVEELKSELAKRPHITNKKEGKLQRQEAAKRKT